MFVLGGLRVIMEGKFSDIPDAENIVFIMDPVFQTAP